MALILGVGISALACVVAFGVGCAWMHRRMEDHYVKVVTAARDLGYEAGMADMYATKAQMYEHWKQAIRRPSLVAGVDEAEGRHAVSRAALESPTDVFAAIMHREFIEDEGANA